MQSRNDAACEIVLIPDTLGTKEFIREVSLFHEFNKYGIWDSKRKVLFIEVSLFHGPRLEGFLCIVVILHVQWIHSLLGNSFNCIISASEKGTT